MEQKTFNMILLIMSGILILISSYFYYKDIQLLKNEPCKLCEETRGKTCSYLNYSPENPVWQEDIDKLKTPIELEGLPE